MKRIKIALLQISVGYDKRNNLKHARESLLRAADAGADILILPEMFFCPYETDLFPLFAEEKGGEGQKLLSETARETNKIIIGGSLPERAENKLFNTSFVFNGNGEEIAFHRKVHLFDVSIRGGQIYRESSVFSPGTENTVFDTKFGKMGLCVCFDFRFCQLAYDMALQGAKAIFVPAAFNMTTGPAHWELLFRQRAIDCQTYTVGVSPSQNTKSKYLAYGHSICCDPWGNVLTQAGFEEEILFAELDFSYEDEIRNQLPILNKSAKDSVLDKKTKMTV